MFPERDSHVHAVERIDDAREADQRVLEHLARLGCDPAAPRETRHYLYMPERARADEAAEELDTDGWQTSVERDETGWLVVAARSRTLTAELVRETRIMLEALAARHGGVYDGWEAPTG